MRAPEEGETPLSLSEVFVLFGFKPESFSASEIKDDSFFDDLDTWPVKRVHRAAGTWGVYSPGLRHAQVFDGLAA